MQEKNELFYGYEIDMLKAAVSSSFSLNQLCLNQWPAVSVSKQYPR